MKLPYSPTLMLVEGYVGIYKIYVLKNPFTNEIFYVGQTMQELHIRLAGHVNETGGSNREKIHYIKSIIEDGGKPIIEAIEVISTKCYIDKVMVNDRELYWIKFHKDKGCNLLNKAGIDTDGTNYEYRNYLSSIKKGETSYHYYVCGKTRGGYEVYDEQKLKADGFVLNIPKPPEPESKKIKQEETRFYYNPYAEKVSVKHGGHWLEFEKVKSVIKTETFPPQPFWSIEFKKGLIYSDTDEFSHWHELDDDDCDYEDSELDGEYLDDEEEYDGDKDCDDEYTLQPETGEKWYFHTHVVDVLALETNIEDNEDRDYINENQEEI